jgi:RNA polymerase sigma factor (sigma-70 family)
VGFNDAGLYAWLRTVIRNKAIDDYRRRHRIVMVDPLEDGARLDQSCTEQHSGNPVHELLAREHAKLARNLVDQCMTVILGMPEHLRIAILLRGEGQSSSRIGAQMGVDSSTVRGYWQQAIRTLTATLGDVIKILDDTAQRDRQGEGAV